MVHLLGILGIDEQHQMGNWWFQLEQGPPKSSRRGRIGIRQRSDSGQISTMPIGGWSAVAGDSHEGTAWSQLKSLAREIIANNDNLKSTYTTEMAYSQLLTSLPEQYEVIRDSQRERTEEKPETKLARLKIKETNLKGKTESIYYSKSNLSRILSLKSPSTYRQSHRYHSSKSSGSNIPRRLRRKIRSCFFYEFIKYIVLFYFFIFKVKEFIRLRSRYSSILRSDREKSRNRNKNNRSK